jgi:flagellum-specific peptidoglycan hydrolase FlgJ
MIDALDFQLLAQQLGCSQKLSCFLYAQACHESGNGQSSLAKNYNNFFGMGFPTVRSTTATGKVMLRDNLGGYSMYYATYKNWQDSLRDRVLWSKARRIFDQENGQTNVNTWCSLLRSKGYFTATVSSYAQGVSNHLNKCVILGPTTFVTAVPYYVYAISIVLIIIYVNRR